MRRDVVITGLGILSCAGGDAAAAREKFLGGICCLTPIRDPRAAGLRARFAGQVAGFQSAPELAGHDRHVHLALAAAHEALGAAAAQPEQYGRRMGLVFSTCSGPMLLIEAHYERIIRGQPQITADELFAKRYHSAAPVLARTLGIGGLCTTVVTACSASSAAIALAADLVRCGMLDAALAGGADALSVSTLAGFDGLKATSDGKCAPFSKPPGLNLGEAAAFAFLETAAAAHERGVSTRAVILGSGTSNDAYHCSAPESGGRGLAAAIRRALDDAALRPEEISYINAHGTGTEANDKAECKAIRKVFPAPPPISSTKSMVGHCLGAAGAVEVIASIICAEADVLPPTANFTELRDGCAVDCVPQAGRTWPGPKVFLSNNSAFGGHNVSLALALEQAAPRNPKLDTAAHPRIFITACGIVSAAGVGLDALDAARQEGRSGLRPVTLSELPPLTAGLVDDVAVEAADRRLNLRAMDRCSKWATVAARLAIREAKFSEKPAALAELGLFLNLAAGPSWAESEFLTSFLGNDHQVAQLAAFPYIVPSSVAGNVCRALLLSGHNLTLNPGPAAGLFGLAPALAAMRAGHASALLCGAVDELSYRIFADNFFAGRLDQPPGEGAAVLMLETAERGAQPLAEVLGLAIGTKPAPSAHDLEEVIDAALTEARVDRAEMDAAAFSGDMEIAPAVGWRGKLLQAAGITGHLEGAQPLLDLAAALRSPELPSGGCLLLGAVAPQGVVAAIVRKA